MWRRFGAFDPMSPIRIPSISRGGRTENGTITTSRMVSISKAYPTIRVMGETVSAMENTAKYADSFINFVRERSLTMDLTLDMQDRLYEAQSVFINGEDK